MEIQVKEKGKHTLESYEQQGDHLSPNGHACPQQSASIEGGKWHKSLAENASRAAGE